MTYPTRWQVPLGYSATDDIDVFPVLPGQLFMSSKSPKYPATIIKTAASGREVRAQMASQPTWDFKIGYEWLAHNPPTVSHLEILQAFFLTRNGQAQPFLFMDPNDNAVSSQLIGTGDGSTKTFQLCRAINAGAVTTFVESIYAVLGTPVVTVGGVPTTAFSIGPYGSITFTTAPAPAAQIAWTGQFLFLCRFAQDDLDAEQMTLNLWSQKGLAFTSFHP